MSVVNLTRGEQISQGSNLIGEGSKPHNPTRDVPKQPKGSLAEKMENQMEPIKVPRSLFWDLKLKRGRFHNNKDEEWEEEEAFSSGIGSSEYEQDSSPETRHNEMKAHCTPPKRPSTGFCDEVDEGVYCTSESDDQDLPQQLRDAITMETMDDSCSNMSTDTSPPGDEQHFIEFTQALQKQVGKTPFPSINGLPLANHIQSPLKLPHINVPKNNGSNINDISISPDIIKTTVPPTIAMSTFNTTALNLNMVPVIAQDRCRTVPSTVAPVVTFPILNWPYRPVQCYQTMSHQLPPTPSWKGKPPPGMLYSNIVPPVFKKAIDIAAGASTLPPAELPIKSNGYIPLPKAPHPVYPLSSIIKTPEQRDKLQQWLCQHQSQQKFDINMVCEICEDRATGLHYGIITCEGCKGFFKRTVQNKRIYTCISEEKCVVTKALRNRCQFCRFKKCIGKGMILAAVREDRMPGGRNNGSMYRNICKAKYKKHRRRLILPGQSAIWQALGVPDYASSGSSLGSASLGSSARHNLLEEALRANCRKSMLPSITEEKQEVCEKVEELAASARVIQKLLECEAKQNIGTLNFSLSSQDTVAQVLAQLGDDIVSQLVDWTQKLPYYDRLPLPLHTQLLTTRWHELVLLTMAVHISRTAPPCPTQPSSALINQNKSVKETSERYLEKIHHFMRNILHKNLTLEEVKEEIGEVIGKMTFIFSILQDLCLSQEEYVCLKVLVLLSQGQGETNRSLLEMQDLHLAALDHYINQRYPGQWSRLGQLLLLIPQISSVAAHLLKNRMIYVPFLLNNNLTHKKKQQSEQSTEIPVVFLTKQKKQGGQAPFK